VNLVNDIGRPSNSPNSLPSPSNPLGNPVIADYRSWRRLAVAVRASVIKTTPEGALKYLLAWASDPSFLAKGVLPFKADPKVDDLRWPKVPMGAGALLAMGGAEVFTNRVDQLVNYVRRGNSMVPEGEGTYALQLARTRKVKVGGSMSGLKKFGLGVATTVFGGLVLYITTRGIESARRKRD